MGAEPQRQSGEGTATTPADGSSAAPAAPRKKPLLKRRYFQFSLASLLIFVTLVCLGAFQGRVWMRQMEDEEAAIAELQRRGAIVDLMELEANELDSDHWGVDARPPLWFRKLVGKADYCGALKVKIMRWGSELRPFGTNATEEHLRMTAQLPGVRELVIHGIRINDESLLLLKDLRHLEVLALIDTSVTGSGLEHLKYLSNLRRVSLSGSATTAAGIASLSALPNLRYLSLDGSLGERVRENIDDSCLKSLVGCTSLEEIDLYYTNVSGVGFVHLAHLPLRAVRIHDCPITYEGMCALLDLPNSPAIPQFDVDLAPLQHKDWNGRTFERVTPLLNSPDFPVNSRN